MLRLRATVVKELNGTVYTVFVAPRVLVASHVNSLLKQTLVCLNLASMLEPCGLYRTDGERPDGVTMILWEMGKQLVWDVTLADALAQSRLNQGSLCNPETTATEAEARKIEKHRELNDNGHLFQPLFDSLSVVSYYYIHCLIHFCYRIKPSSVHYFDSQNDL